MHGHAATLHDRERIGTGQTALGSEHLPCIYLPHHELIYSETVEIVLMLQPP